MRSPSFLLGVLWLVACGDAGADGSSETTESPSSETAADGCAPGWESCPCHDGVCIAGLKCLSGFCVAVPGGESSPTQPGSSEAGPSTLDSSDASSSEMGTSSADEASSSSAEGTSSSSESPAEEGPPPECFEGDTFCDEDPDAFDDDHLMTCVGGSWQTETCAEHCAVTGYGVGSPGCDTTDRCRCSGHLDSTCSEGAYARCLCRDYVLQIECEDIEADYPSCFAGELDLSCWAPYYQVLSVEDCQMAVEACE